MCLERSTDADGERLFASDERARAPRLLRARVGAALVVAALTVLGLSTPANAQSPTADPLSVRDIVTLLERNHATESILTLARRGPVVLEEILALGEAGAGPDLLGKLIRLGSADGTLRLTNRTPNGDGDEARPTPGTTNTGTRRRPAARQASRTYAVRARERVLARTSRAGSTASSGSSASAPRPRRPGPATWPGAVRESGVARHRVRAVHLSHLGRPSHLRHPSRVEHPLRPVLRGRRVHRRHGHVHPGRHLNRHRLHLGHRRHARPAFHHGDGHRSFSLRHGLGFGFRSHPSRFRFRSHLPKFGVRSRHVRFGHLRLRSRH